MAELARATPRAVTTHGRSIPPPSPAYMAATPSPSHNRWWVQVSGVAGANWREAPQSCDRRETGLTPTGKPPPLAVRLEKALPFRRWVATRASCGSPASQATLQPQAQRGERRTGGTPYPENISEARSWCHLRFSAPRGMSPPPPPSGGILPQYPPLGGYPQTTRSAGGR